MKKRCSMSFNIPKININLPRFVSLNNNNSSNRPTFKSQPQKPDTFELSVGYINDTHGQANNMMRILSGFKGDLRLSGGDNDIGDEKNKAIHKATAMFLNSAKVQASAFGNHELDTTQADFIDNMRITDAKYLSANFKKNEKWEELEDNLEEYGRANVDKELDSSTIVEVKGEKIGIVGTSPIDMFDRTTHPAYHKDCQVDSLEDTIEDIQEEVDELKEKGINKIFLVSHLGYKKDQIVAEKTDGIDVIIGGHTHELIKDIKEGENLRYSKTGEPVIITQAGKDGKYFGELNLTFDKEGIVKKAQNNIAETHRFHKNYINQYLFNQILGTPEKIGYIKSAPLPPTTLIEENPHANFVCDAMKHVTNSEIAVWNNCGIRNFFHEGEINSSDIKDIAPFFDRISVANISEDKIVNMFKTTIEATYKNPASYKPGLTAVSGLEYGVDEKEGKLAFLNYIDKEGNKHSIDIENPRKDKTYKLVTDEFIMSHGADYPILATAEECLEIYPYDKDVMTCQYIKELNMPIVINQTGRIHFV